MRPMPKQKRHVPDILSKDEISRLIDSVTNIKLLYDEYRRQVMVHNWLFPGREHIQELLGDASSRTTKIYTHVSRPDIRNIHSPVEGLAIDRKGEVRNEPVRGEDHAT